MGGVPSRCGRAERTLQGGQQVRAPAPAAGDDIDGESTGVLAGRESDASRLELLQDSSIEGVAGPETCEQVAQQALSDLQRKNDVWNLSIHDEDVFSRGKLDLGQDLFREAAP